MSQGRLQGLYLQFKPFIKYCVVGTLGTLIDLGSFYVFREFVGIGLFLSTVMAFLLAVCNNFILNKIWTFQNKHKNFRKQFIKFLIVAVIGLLLSLLSMYVFVYLLDFARWQRLGELLAKACTSLVVLTWNFLGNKFWTFRDKIWDSAPTGDFQYELSVVIPAYNEAKRIADTLEYTITYLDKHIPSYEILVADDGSKDQTVQIVKKIMRNTNTLKLLQLGKNQGKGAAVKAGVLASTGKYVLFMDADNSTRIEQIEKMLSIMKEEDASVVIGSRYLRKDSVKIKQPWYRVMIGRVGNWLIRMLIVDNVMDTQCGFKLFKHKAAFELFNRMKIKRFGFDMEILTMAQKVFEFKIIEVPVDWYDAAGSRVRPIKAAIRTFLELIWIKINLMSGRYL